MVDGNILEQFIGAIKTDAIERNTTRSAVVSKIDNEGTVWVYVSGSDTETPTAVSASEVKKGDSVNVEWRNNKLYIAGNYSDPSAGSARVSLVENTANSAAQDARRANTAAQIAEQSAEKAVEDAGRANTAANHAQSSADKAEALATYIDQQTYGTITYEYVHGGITEIVYRNPDGTYYYFDDETQVTVSEYDLEHDADTGELITNRANDGLNATIEAVSDLAVQAGESADRAEGYALDALSSAESATTSAKLARNQLSDVEKVVDVLTWTAEHGVYELTTDIEVEDGRYYFTYDGSKYSVVEDPTGNPSAQGWYILDSVDEAITHYVSTHLALTDDGLYVQTDDNDYKVLISSDGIFLMRGADPVATYSDTVTLGNKDDLHIVLSDSELGFYESTDKVAYINTFKLFITSAEITDSLRIGNFIWKPRDGRLTLMYDPVS